MQLALVYSWMMVSLRGLGIVLLFPTLGAQHLPAVVRVALSMALASVMYAIVPHVQQLPPNILKMVIAAGGEILLGLAMGFVGRLVFATVDAAGRIINSEVGLGGMPGIDTPRPAEEPLAALLSMFAGLLFFLSGAHLGCLAAFARSFDFAPAGQPAFGAVSAETLIVATGNVIELGFRIASPFIAMNFLINLAFSVLGRAVPKMNVFITSFTIRIIVGMSLLATSGMLLARYLWVEFDNLPGRMLDLLPLK
jgi:flagellar biosynthesis protein FliR